ncbi:HAMP domain-containing histidine kinase, partial [bacterium]|nr:HAMP domain-containing histidine kinase [bacterium]
MFRRVRIELVAWYAGSLALILVAIGLSAYFFLRSSLDHEINDSIEHTYEDVVEHPRPARGGLPETPLSGALRDAAFAAVPTDVFVVVTDTEGHLLTNPRQVSLKNVDFEKLSSGVTNNGGTWNDVGSGDTAYRIASYPYADGNVIHIGRSLEARNTQLDRLSLVMLIGGIAGLVLATGGGLWLACRSLVPIRRSFETQRRFVSDASHELRTPIAVVRANNELLQRHPEETIGENIDQVDAIAAESEHLTRLIEDLLMLARADEGRLALAPGEFDLAELATEVTRDLAPVAAQKGISLSINATPVRVEADRQRIRQVLVILLDNALKYGRAGDE